MTAPNFHYLRLTPIGVKKAVPGALFAVGPNIFAIIGPTTQSDVFAAKRVLRVSKADKPKISMAVDTYLNPQYFTPGK